MHNHTTDILVTVSAVPRIFDVGPPVETHSLCYIFTLVEQYLFSLKMYIQSMNDGLSDDIKEKLML